MNLKMLIKRRKNPKKSQEITKKKEGNFVNVPDQILNQNLIVINQIIIIVIIIVKIKNIVQI